MRKFSKWPKHVPLLVGDDTRETMKLSVEDFSGAQLQRVRVWMRCLMRRVPVDVLHIILYFARDVFRRGDVTVIQNLLKSARTGAPLETQTAIRIFRGYDVYIEEKNISSTLPIVFSRVRWGTPCKQVIIFSKKDDALQPFEQKVTAMLTNISHSFEPPLEKDYLSKIITVTSNVRYISEISIQDASSLKAVVVVRADQLEGGVLKNLDKLITQKTPPNCQILGYYKSPTGHELNVAHRTFCEKYICDNQIISEMWQHLGPRCETDHAKTSENRTVRRYNDYGWGAALGQRVIKVKDIAARIAFTLKPERDLPEGMMLGVVPTQIFKDKLGEHFSSVKSIPFPGVVYTTSAFGGLIFVSGTRGPVAEDLPTLRATETLYVTVNHTLPLITFHINERLIWSTSSLKGYTPPACDLSPYTLLGGIGVGVTFYPIKTGWKRHEGIQR